MHAGSTPRKPSRPKALRTAHARAEQLVGERMADWRRDRASWRGRRTAAHVGTAAVSAAILYTSGRVAVARKAHEGRRDARGRR